MNMTSSYDESVWRLTVVLDTKRYVYREVSPYHQGVFFKKAKQNRGRAMAYVSDFPLVPACAVCGMSNLEDQEICFECGWQCDSAETRPEKCTGGPNAAPLRVVKERWDAGERDRKKLAQCPTRLEAIGCNGCQYDAHPEE